MGNEKNGAKRSGLDEDTYAHKLFLADFLREPVIRSAMDALSLPSGSRGLDAGCGIGRHALWLAEAVGADGHVTGLDLKAELLDHARKTSEKSGLSDRVSFRQGDIARLPFDDNTFDWVWSTDCAGYPAVGPLPVVEELARVVKPGGCVAILAWSSQQLLPGYPSLEARLNAPCSAIAPFVKGKPPESLFLRALGWFRDASLEKLSGHTFAGDVQAPLSDDVRNALTLFFEMLWDDTRSAVTPQDWAEYERFCRPESPDFILNLPDYYAFFTYTMFRGTVKSGHESSQS